MRVIVIVERTREEKEENRLAVIAANMPLLDSNAGFPLLRLCLPTVSETIIQLSKEKNVCLTKEEARVTLVFRNVFLVLSMLSSRSTIRAATDHLDIYYIYMRVCLLLALSAYMHIYVCLDG
jgi:hypothetical protein